MKRFPFQQHPSWKEISPRDKQAVIRAWKMGEKMPLVGISESIGGKRIYLYSMQGKMNRRDCNGDFVTKR